MNKLKWALKQLLPLKYHTTVSVDGVMAHYDWKMFMGKCYNINKMETSK